MKLCNIAKFVYPLCLEPANLNYHTLKGWSSFAEKVYIVALSPDERSHRATYFGNVEIIQIPRRRNPLWNHLHFMFCSFGWGWRLARSGQVDLFDGSHPADGGLVAVALKWLTGRKAVVEVQGELLNLFEAHLSPSRARAHRWSTWLACRFSDGVRCVSERIREQVAAAGISPDKLWVIPSRCDTVLFGPGKFRRERTDSRRRLGLEAGDVAGIFTGRLIVHKGVRYLIEALPAVLKEHSRFRLLLVGDGPLKSELQSQASSLGVSHAVQFLGPASFLEIPGLLACADLFVLPSINEGMPRSLLEAMAMGLPAVATRVGGVPEVMEDGKVGYLVPPSDPNALAGALGRLLADESLREKMGIRARERVLEEYSFEVGMKKFEAFFRSVIGFSNRSGR